MEAFLLPFSLFGGPFLSLWGALLGHAPPPTKSSAGANVDERVRAVRASASGVVNGGAQGKEGMSNTFSFGRMQII